MTHPTERPPCQVKLVFNRDDIRVIEVPATVKCIHIRRYIRERYYRSCAIYLLPRNVDIGASRAI